MNSKQQDHMAHKVQRSNNSVQEQVTVCGLCYSSARQ